MSLGPPSDLGATGQERLRHESLPAPLSPESKLRIEREAVARSPYKSSSTCRVCGRYLQDTSTPEAQRIRENAQGCCDSHLETRYVWCVYEQSDKTEGRGRMVRCSHPFDTEQEAWDSINTRGGVMGCLPKNLRWTKQPVSTWQEFKEVQGYGGDYDVRKLLMHDGRLWMEAI